MGTITKFLAFVLLSYVACAASLTGSLASPYGGLATGVLTLALSSPAAVSPTCGGSLPGQPYQMTVTGGTLVAPPPVVGNDCLVPANTYYNVTFKNASNGVLFTGQWLIRGSTFDVGSVVIGQAGLLNNMSGADQFVTQAPGTALYVNTLNVNSCTGCGGGGTPATVSTVFGPIAISAAEWQNANNVPVQLLAAPGVGKAIILDTGAVNYVCVSCVQATNYSAFVQYLISWGGDPDTIFNGGGVAMPFQSGAVASYLSIASAGLGSSATNQANQPIILALASEQSVPLPGRPLTASVGSTAGTGYSSGEIVSAQCDPTPFFCYLSVTQAGGIPSSLTPVHPLAGYTNLVYDFPVAPGQTNLATASQPKTEVLGVGGTGYAAGDTGDIDASGQCMTKGAYQVVTAPGGIVATFTVLLPPTGCPSATLTTQPDGPQPGGGDSGFTIVATAATDSGTLVANIDTVQAASGGTATLAVSGTYHVITVQ